jgi:hypothetical protein
VAFSLPVCAGAGTRLEPGQVEDVLATLYERYAVLPQHFVQKEESYFALASEAPAQKARPQDTATPSKAPTP